MAVKRWTNTRQQFLDTNGDPYSGGKLYWYVAGSTTAQDTFNASDGLSANANPVVLGSDGRPQSEIWLTTGASYKLVFKDSSDATVFTEDNIDPVNDTALTVNEWLDGPTPTYIGASSFSLVGDQTSTFTVGRRVKIVDAGGTKYGTILTSVYSSVTTITLDADSDSLASPTTSLAYGIINQTNTSAPRFRPLEKLRSKSENYTTVMADADGTILHPSSDDNPRTFTIDSNANVAYEIGTVLTFVNEINVLTIAITSDTLTRAISNTTGSVILPAAGWAKAKKVTSTSWLIWGEGLATSLTVPSGTTAQRAGSPATGETRYNSTTSNLEWYDGAEWRPVGSFNLTAEVDMTNGGSNDLTSVDITGIPAWAKLIVLSIYNCSTSGTSALGLQLGDTNGFDSSYAGTNAGHITTNSNAVALSGSGTIQFTAGAVVAAGGSSATIILSKMDDDKWVVSWFADASSATYIMSLGIVHHVLTDPLTQLRVTTVGGSDTFDLGDVNIAIMG